MNYQNDLYLKYTILDLISSFRSLSLIYDIIEYFSFAYMKLIDMINKNLRNSKVDHENAKNSISTFNVNYGKI